MTAPDAVRGEVWLADLGEGRGHEQSGVRPVLVISASEIGTGPGGLAVIVPLTTTHRPAQPLHVGVMPPEGGARRPSFVMCEQVRAVSRNRLLRHWGAIDDRTMDAVDHRLRVVLELV